MQLQPSSLVTSASLDKTSSGSLIRHQNNHKQSQRMTLQPLFPRGLQIQTIPLFEKDYPLVDHTYIYQSTFNTQQPIGASLLSSHPGQRPCPSLYGLVYRVVLGITRLYTGNMLHWTTVREAAKLFCGLPNSTAFKLTEQTSSPQFPLSSMCMGITCNTGTKESVIHMGN